MKTKQTPLEMRDNFVSFSNLEKPSVTQSLSKAYEEKIERNRAALISIIGIIVTLSTWNIAFRGNWNKEFLEEDGKLCTAILCQLERKVWRKVEMAYFERKSVHQICFP
jgi:hypothetical protein